MDVKAKIQGEIYACQEEITYHKICIEAIRGKMNQAKLALKRWKREQKRRTLRKIKKKVGPEAYEKHKQKRWKAKAKRRVIRWEKRRSVQGQEPGQN